MAKRRKTRGIAPKTCPAEITAPKKIKVYLESTGEAAEGEITDLSAIEGLEHKPREIYGDDVQMKAGEYEYPTIQAGRNGI
jgi:hypothetical protein